MANKTYLGDSVYAEVVNDGMIVLTTENGIGPSNIIYLDPEVIVALQKFIQQFADTHKQT
jgi:hypothetical protein